MNEIEEDTNEWKDILCTWIGRINFVKMSKAICGFTAILSKIPMAFFTEIEKNNPKICMESQKTLDNQGILEKEK